jgi:hypothetical protein
MAGFHRAGDWAVLATKFATRLITVEKWFSNAGVPNDLVPEVAGDAFRAVTPEHDFLLHVNYAEPDQHTFQNAATNLGIVEWRHRLPHHQTLN